MFSLYIICGGEESSFVKTKNKLSSDLHLSQNIFRILKMTAKLNRKWATRSKVASNNTALTEATNLYKRKTLQVPEAAPPTEVQRRSKAFSAVGLDWFPVEVNWTSGTRTAYQLWHTALTLATGPQSGGGRRETVYPPAPLATPTSTCGGAADRGTKPQQCQRKFTDRVGFRRTFWFQWKSNFYFWMKEKTNTLIMWPASTSHTCHRQ